MCNDPAIGSGKSTVLRLIARFADPNEGRVLVDGHDLRQVTQSSLRQQIGIVFQDMLLVDDTIRGNIRLGRRDATDSEIEAVASLIGLHRLVEARDPLQNCWPPGTLYSRLWQQHELG